MLRRKHFCTAVSARAAGVLIVLFAILVFAYVSILANVYRHASIDQTASADVIIVLGASQWNGMPSPIFQARLDHAYDLYKAGYAPRMILTGGFGEGDVFSESKVGMEYLVGRGVPPSVMSIEEVSHTTLQSVREAIRIIRAEGYRSAILVSHDFHSMRAKKMAQDLGLVVFVSSVATRSVAQKFRYSVREVWAYILYETFDV